MATLSHSTEARDAIAVAVTGLINVGGGGSLFIQTENNLLDLAVLPMSATAFAGPVNGVATANAITEDTSTAAGAAAAGQIKDGNGLVILNFDVATANASVNLSSADIGNGDTLTITALTYTAAP